MSTWYEHKAIVDSRDVDGFGRCRPSALLGHLQQAATLAAQVGGFGRGDFMGRYGAVWMLARMWYQLDRPLTYEQELSIHTWHRGGRGASMYRDFDLYANGSPIGQAVSVWTLVRLADRHMLRLSDVPELGENQGGARSKDILLTKIRMPEDLQPVEQRCMHYSDTDINAHVNNNRYADFACDAIRAHERVGEYVREMQLGYSAECRPGECIHILAAERGRAHFVRGVDENGKTRFDVAMKLGQDIS